MELQVYWAFGLWSMRLAVAKGLDVMTGAQIKELEGDIELIDAAIDNADGGLGNMDTLKQNTQLDERGRACFDRERLQGRLPGPGYAYCLTNLPARAQDTAVR